MMKAMDATIVASFQPLPPGAPVPSDRVGEMAAIADCDEPGNLNKGRRSDPEVRVYLGIPASGTQP